MHKRRNLDARQTMPFHLRHGHDRSQQSTVYRWDTGLPERVWPSRERRRKWRFAQASNLTACTPNDRSFASLVYVYTACLWGHSIFRTLAKGNWNIEKVFVRKKVSWFGLSLLWSLLCLGRGEQDSLPGAEAEMASDDLSTKPPWSRFVA